MEPINTPQMIFCLICSLGAPIAVVRVVAVIVVIVKLNI